MGKTNRRRMHGGDWWNPFGLGNSNPTDATTDPTGISGVAKKAADAVVYGADKIVEGAATASKKTTDSLGITSPDSQGTAGGRRRRHRNRMHGGDFIPNSPLSGFSSNATEVHDIKMAQPQTLVGGRRRKSSRRRGKSRGKSQRKSRRSRRSRSSRRM